MSHEPRVRLPRRPAAAAAVGVAAAAFLLWAAAPLLAGDATFRSREHHFEVTFPAGWREVPRDAAEEYARTVSAVMRQKMSYVAFYEREGATEHFQYPYVMIDYHGGDTRFYREFSRQMEGGLRQATKTLTENAEGLLANVSFGTPVLEAARSRFWLKIQMEVMGVPVTGLSCLQMGSEGIAVLNCYSTSEDFAEHEATFRAMADTLRFEAGYRHDPAARPGFFSTTWGRIVLFALIGGVIGLLRGLLAKRGARPRVVPETATLGGLPLPPSEPRPPSWYQPPPRASAASAGAASLTPEPRPAVARPLASQRRF